MRMKENMDHVSKDSSGRTPGRLGYDDVVSLYVILFFMLFLIAMISMWQSRRIDRLRVELEALRTRPVAAATGYHRLSARWRED